MKKLFKLFLISFALLSLFLTILWFRGVKEREDAMAVEIEPIDITLVPDGIYYGHYEGGIHGYRENAVEVTVENGVIISIQNIINHEQKSDEFLTVLYGDVIRYQSLDIDAQSGATLTTKAYVKSIEIALSDSSK